MLKENIKKILIPILLTILMFVASTFDRTALKPWQVFFIPLPIFFIFLVVLPGILSSRFPNKVSNYTNNNIYKYAVASIITVILMLFFICKFIIPEWGDIKNDMSFYGIFYLLGLGSVLIYELILKKILNFLDNRKCKTFWKFFWKLVVYTLCLVVFMIPTIIPPPEIIKIEIPVFIGTYSLLGGFLGSEIVSMLKEYQQKRE